MGNKLINLLNIFGLLAVAGILLAASIMQFMYNEPPCPLCLLQRFAFMMIAAGFMLNVRLGVTQRHYGIVLLGAVFGVCASLRQIALHVLSGTPAFGTSLWGFHFYTWAFVCFVIVIVGVALLMLLWDEKAGHVQMAYARLGTFASIVTFIIVVGNVISLVFECGPYNCPDNSSGYWLIELFSQKK